MKSIFTDCDTFLPSNSHSQERKNILFVLLNWNDADFNWKKKKKVIQNVWTGRGGKCTFKKNVRKKS